jgi:hypothetical protein
MLITLSLLKLGLVLKGSWSKGLLTVMVGKDTHTHISLKNSPTSKVEAANTETEMWTCFINFKIFLMF